MSRWYKVKLAVPEVSNYKSEWKNYHTPAYLFNDLQCWVATIGITFCKTTIQLFRKIWLYTAIFNFSVWLLVIYIQHTLNSSSLLAGWRSQSQNLYSRGQGHCHFRHHVICMNFNFYQFTYFRGQVFGGPWHPYSWCFVYSHMHQCAHQLLLATPI